MEASERYASLLGGSAPRPPRPELQIETPTPKRTRWRRQITEHSESSAPSLEIQASATIAVVGYGGGQGRTTTAAAIGRALAELAAPERVTVGDICGHDGDLAARLSVTEPIDHTLRALNVKPEVESSVPWDQQNRIYQQIPRGPDGLGVLGSPTTCSVPPVTPWELRAAQDALLRWPQILVLDAPPTLTAHGTEEAVSRSAAIAVVASRTARGLNGLEAAISAANEFGLGRRIVPVVVNTAPKMAAQRPALRRLEARGVDPLELPYDRALDGPIEWERVSARTKKAITRISMSLFSLTQQNREEREQ